MALAADKDATATDEYGFDLPTPGSFDAGDGKHPFGSSSGIYEPVLAGYRAV